MKLTVKQAAERIRVSSSTIKTLLKRGMLTDLKPRVEGAGKHFAIVESKQLDEVAREQGLRGRNMRTAGTANGYGNPKPTVMVPAAPYGALARIEERLARIEEQTAALLAVWS